MDPADALALLMSPEGRVDPYPTYELLRAHGPVVQAGPVFFVVTGYAEADAILRDARFGVLDDALRDQFMPGWRESPAILSISRSMLRTNPPDHSRMRRLAAGAFTPRRIATMHDVVRAQADELVDAMLAAEGPVDFMAGFAYPLPVGVICALLGVPAADRPLFRRWATDLTGVLEPEITEEELAVADRGASELRAYFTELVAARRRAPADDLTSALVQAHDGGDRLSGDELLANLIVLLVAGFETTTNLLGNGLVALLEHPRAAATLAEHPEFAPGYVDELLRYDSPVQLTSRMSTAPARYGDVDLPPESWVIVMLGAANRDPRRYPEPARFDPWRPQVHPLSFGAGPHYCLGAALARLEAQVAFPLLLRRLPGLAVAGRPERRVRLTLRGHATLPVRVGREASPVTVPGTPPGAAGPTP
ncbi:MULTISPECIES: cytochrome P450 [unclassified Micromonospora]|uniref:cytochrome P450 n=1 Tax=Micromonospora TaxID=1873 RepID=UPI0003EEA85A|nr:MULTISPECIES: cytochrome P450 [unclassified Micromonospora]EWM64428.1 cytochrome P450 [Micromonospora sp. M42]MCK1806528.1 cytochrome P450 [Micromonospora sp. R42106]MCK1835140.1 cytochrome P450 [Micromonospora sp. R42003]MCK1846324.1 cytochrome P450 [Micromonospora sp. R42004]MCM1018442.1 cytochrome P450 [Micromonospora sp. XM-20-01]